MKKSFAEYLIENFGKQAIAQYWSNKNTINPFKIGYSSKNKVWLICQNKNYHDDYLISPHNFCQNQRCPCCSGRKLHIYDSLYYWCKENNRHDILQRWDYQLNDKTPSDYRYTSSHKIWLKCPRNLHESHTYKVLNITTCKNSPCIKCKSIAQFLLDKYGDNALELYWSDRNTISPFDISIENSTVKCWFKCSNNKSHNDYEMRPSDFKRNHRCPYCVGRKTTKQDSFGQWCIDNVDNNFIEIYWSDKNTLDPFSLTKRSNKDIWIKCSNKDHPDYKTKVGRYYSGARCPYCSNNRICKTNSLGYLHPDLVKYWSKNNKETIFEVARYTTNKYLWKCSKHGEFESSPHIMIDSYYKCPKCSIENISQYEDKVLKYLSELNIKCLNEYSGNLICYNPKTGHRLPYDNELPDYKLIIEVHGAQHYNPKNFWSKNLSKTEMIERFNYQKWKDNYKKEFAIKNNYNFIEIPYWNFQSDYYKKVIYNKINEIKNNTPTTTERENSI